MPALIQKSVPAPTLGDLTDRDGLPALLGRCDLSIASGGPIGEARFDSLLPRGAFNAMSRNGLFADGRAHSLVCWAA
jgi:hypothetical protein